MADIFLRINEGKVTLASDYGTITIAYPEPDAPNSYPKGQPWYFNPSNHCVEVAEKYTNGNCFLRTKPLPVDIDKYSVLKFGLYPSGRIANILVTTPAWKGDEVIAVTRIDGDDRVSDIPVGSRAPLATPCQPSPPSPPSPKSKQIAITYTSNDGDTISLNLGAEEG